MAVRNDAKLLPPSGGTFATGGKAGVPLYWPIYDSFFETGLKSPLDDAILGQHQRRNGRAQDRDRAVGLRQTTKTRKRMVPERLCEHRCRLSGVPIRVFGSDANPRGRLRDVCFSCPVFNLVPRSTLLLSPRR